MISLCSREVFKIGTVKRIVILFLTIGLFCSLGSLLGPTEARALTCELLFHPAQTAGGDRIVLQAAYDRLLAEQKDVRDRVWLPNQITEISQKGRLEFEDREKAIKYYRGLIVWKLRALQEEIAKISDRQRLADYKAKWPATIRIEQNEISLYSLPRELFRALDLSLSLYKISEPSAEQVAVLMTVANRIRSLNRTAWADREAGEAAMLELLRKVFPDANAKNVADISEALKIPPAEKFICCGRGNCEGCTHPNVVFRNKAEWPGPTYKGPDAASTLPLYRLLDFLKTRFPNSDLGSNFWDRVIR